MEVEKYKKVELKSGFILYGDIVNQNEAGIWFRTKTETSFLSWDIIKSIRDDTKYKDRGL